MDNLVRGRTQTVSLAKSKPKLDSVLRIHGYKEGAKVRPAVVKAAETAIQALTDVVQPTVSYRIVAVDCLDEDKIVLENGVSMKSQIFQRYMNNSKEAVIFALTAGKAVDDQTIQWMDEELLVEALFLESAAWLSVENATKQFVITTRRWAHKQQLRITRRLGPGYSYPIDGHQIQWDLFDQKKLFTVFDDTQIPISLLESAAMLPKMSRSGMYGLLPE